MKKNPFHSLAASTVNRKFERHIQGPRDTRGARRIGYRMKLAGETFRVPFTPSPFCK